MEVLDYLLVVEKIVLRQRCLLKTARVHHDRSLTTFSLCAVRLSTAFVDVLETNFHDSLLGSLILIDVLSCWLHHDLRITRKPTYPLGLPGPIIVVQRGCRTLQRPSGKISGGLGLH